MPTTDNSWEPGIASLCRNSLSTTIKNANWQLLRCMAKCQSLSGAFLEEIHLRRQLKPSIGNVAKTTRRVCPISLCCHAQKKCRYLLPSIIVVIAESILSSTSIIPLIKKVLQSLLWSITDAISSSNYGVTPPSPASLASQLASLENCI